MVKTIHSFVYGLFGERLVPLDGDMYRADQDDDDCLAFLELLWLQ